MSAETTEPGALLARQIENVRVLLPTPAERVLQPDLEAQARLAAKIEAQPDDQTVRQLAAELGSQETATLFPLMVNPETSTRLAGRITLLIHEKACPSLYLSGWITWQHAYPHPAAARALTMLCRTLGSEVRENARKTASPHFSPEINPLLISRMVPPDSRHLTSRLSDRLIKLDFSLDTFIRDYHLIIESALGRELCCRYFLSGPPMVFKTGGSVFEHILPRLALSNQADLISHFLCLDGIEPEDRNLNCQLIYRHFGDSAAETPERHPVWNLVKPRVSEIFHTWVIAATIGSHCRENTRKARFYLEFAPYITKLEHWNDETLMLCFPGFVLADSRNQPGLALYYNQPKLGVHPFSLAGENFLTNPASPAIPHRQVDDAIRMQNFQGIIGLPFDEDGIRLSRVFMGLRLK